MHCPSCASTSIRGLGKRYAFYPCGIVAVIGYPLAMVHQASQPFEYRCKACDASFSHRTIAARITRVMLYVWLIAASAYALLWLAELLGSRS